MDLIGGIKYMENRPGRREPDHGKGKSAPKNARSGALAETNARTVADHSSIDQDTPLGRQIDTTA